MEIVNFIYDWAVPALKSTAVIWVPALAGFLAWDWWVEYVQKQYQAGLKWSLLEIKIPRDVHKSPQAMEFVLNALYQTGGIKTPYARFWEGKVLAFHSLEIVSIEGQIYFFIRVESRFKALVTHQVYGQYPDAEVTEVDDYVKYVPPFAPDNGWEYRACDLSMTAGEGAEDWIPIKTYVDYGLNNDQLKLEEEQRIDPITPLIEFLGSMGKGEQFWFQIVIRAATKRFEGLKESEDWKAKGRQTISKILEEHSMTEKVLEYSDEVGADGKKIPIKKKFIGGYTNLTQNLKQKVDALERNMDRLGFDTGIRAQYVATKDAFKGTRLPLEFTSVLRQFASPNQNGFGMKNFTDDFDYWWQDYKDMRRHKNRRGMFKKFVYRAFFYWPGGLNAGGLLSNWINGTPKSPVFNMTTEELATVFHFPGKVSTTPTFTRIESRKAEPPQNLPI